MKRNQYFEYQAKVNKSYHRLQKIYKELKESYAEMVFRLALMAEQRDESTGTHLVRIADYCTEIAKALGLPKKEIYYLR